MKEDFLTFAGLLVMAVIAFISAGLVAFSLLVGSVSRTIETIAIIYFPAVPLMFAQITFLVFCVITLFFIYKLFTKRWHYDYKIFENDIRGEYRKRGY